MQRIHTAGRSLQIAGLGVAAAIAMIIVVSADDLRRLVVGEALTVSPPQTTVELAQLPQPEIGQVTRARPESVPQSFAPRSAERMIGAISNEAAPVIIGMPSVPLDRAREEPLDPGQNTFDPAAPSGWQVAAEAPVSTFALEADMASWPYIRSSIEMGTMPHPDGVRIEEMLAYFGFDYPAPEQGEGFAASVEIVETPWDDQTEIVRVGIKAFEDISAPRKPQNLVFLIDTSGSMKAPDKLPLLVAGLQMLVNEMEPEDTVAIVTYAGTSGVALPPTPGSEQSKIKTALSALAGGGATAGAEGIVTAYRLAEEIYDPNKANRVVLGSDGDFNVGITDLDELEAMISKKRETGIFLSVLGVGRQGYNDAIAQRLAQNGNGNAYFLDSLSEARKVLVEDLAGTLNTVAVDAKAQIEWNPALVGEYRLLGYETRALNREDFHDDTVDAGEIGEGHSVTILYEISRIGGERKIDPLRYGVPQPRSAQAGDELGFVKLRYKRPGDEASRLMSRPIVEEDRAPDGAGDDTRFAAAVAAAGMVLRGQNIGMTLAEIATFARQHMGLDESGRRQDFVDVIDLASSLQ